MFRAIAFLFKAILGFFAITVLWALVYRFAPPPITPTMLFDGHGATRDWMGLDTIDRDMAVAAIASEDGNFCSHNGFDYEAIARAWAERQAGQRQRGGSTISQQTAKNVFLWQGGGWFRKGLETYFTGLIELLWGKRRIMEVYLNVAETGIGTYGAEEGSLRYFRHSADHLTPSEAARMAAALPLPKERSVTNPSGWLRRHGNTISARIGVVGRDGLDACVYE